MFTKRFTVYTPFSMCWSNLILKFLHEMLFALGLSEILFFHKVPNIHFSSIFYK